MGQRVSNIFEGKFEDSKVPNNQSIRIIEKREKLQNQDLIINNKMICESDFKKEIEKELSTIPNSSEDEIKIKFGCVSEDIRKIYTFKEVIGGGRFGKVRIGFKTENPEKSYAIKSYKKSNLTKDELDNFISEAVILTSIDHPNIIKVYETYQDKFYFHIVMDLCRGKELINGIFENGVFSENQVCRVVHQILSAIAYCHSNCICHRDLKPENILFEEDTADSDIKIIDFGFSRKFNSRMHTVLGTPYYIAPEVLKGNYNEKCDIWSLGCIMYLMMTGEPPFNGKSPKEVFFEVAKKHINYKPLRIIFSGECVELLERCLEKNPNRRISAIDALSHPFFFRLNEELQDIKHIHLQALNNLRNFNKPHGLKKIVLKYLVNSLSQSKISYLKETFIAINQGQEGFLNANEISQAFRKFGVEISEEEVQGIIRKADFLHLGKIDYNEFIVAAIDEKLLFESQRIVEAFNYFDYDHSGFIDKNDLFKALMRSCQEIVNKRDIDYLIQDVSASEKIYLDDFKRVFGIEN